MVCKPNPPSHTSLCLQRLPNMAQGPQVNSDTLIGLERYRVYIMEVPSCHSKELRFYSVDGEDSLKNLNKRLPGRDVCFRQNILASLVMMNWSGINRGSGSPLYLSRLKMQMGCQCLLIPVPGITAPN